VRFSIFVSSLLITGILLTLLPLPGAAQTVTKSAGVQVNVQKGTAASVAPGATDKRSQGIALYNAKDYRGAAAALDDYLTVNNRDPYAAYYAALANQQTGNSAKSRLLYRQVYQLSPNSQIGGYAKSILLKLDPSFAATVSAASSATASAGGGDSSAVSAQGAEDIARAIIKNNTVAAQPDDDAFDPSMPSECRIHFNRSPHGITLDVFINNRPIAMKFDTGAPSIVLGKNHLATMGIPEPTGPPAGVTGGSSSAETVPFWIIRGSVKVGNIEQRNVPIKVMQYNSAEPLLGQTFFAKYVYTIDDKGEQISFKQKAVAARDTQGGGSVSVPFKFRAAGSRVMVDVEVNGKPFPMIFDTGNTGSACTFMSEGQARRAGITMPTEYEIRQFIGVNGTGSAKCFRIPRLKLGPIEQNNVMVAVNQDIPDSPTGMVDPLLGQAFWQEYQYTIDMPHKLIHFIRR
jgi:predicted aspartyl protease